jgi:hypothetical protein
MEKTQSEPQTVEGLKAYYGGMGPMGMGGVGMGGIGMGGMGMYPGMGMGMGGMYPGMMGMGGYGVSLSFPNSTLAVRVAGQWLPRKAG